MNTPTLTETQEHDLHAEEQDARSIHFRYLCQGEDDLADWWLVEAERLKALRQWCNKESTRKTIPDDIREGDRRDN